MKWKRSITYPLRKRRERLKAQEMERLKSFFRGNPAIELAYEFKERLCGLLNKKSQTAKQCRDNIRKLKEMMKIMKYEAPTEFGSTPKRVDFNERRRIEPRPSICNFGSFYNRKPFVVSVSFSCGSLQLLSCFL